MTRTKNVPPVPRPLPKTRLNARHREELRRACGRLELFSTFLYSYNDPEGNEFSKDARLALADYLDDIWQELHDIVEQGVGGAR